jgi:hypothetical protein
MLAGQAPVTHFLLANVRTVATVLLAVFGLCVAVPVAQALTPSTQCCGPGHCCHHPNPATTDCLRSVCPCGGHESTPPASPVRGEALLRPRAQFEPSETSGLRRALCAAAAPVWRTRSIDHPPPSRPA